MNSSKENLLDLTYSKFFDLMLTSSDPVNLLDGFALEDVMGYGTTLDEKILNLQGLKDLAIMQREQSVGMNISYKPTPVYRKILNKGSSAIIVEEFKITMQVENEKMELDVRMSSIWEFAEGNWKVVHWHASKPEYDSGGNDTWHKEEWAHKQAELEKQVQEKTEELKKQNRELEIQAALERVRSRTSAMQDSIELNEVVAVVYTELAQLGIDVHLSLILIYDWKTKQMEWWSSGQGIDKMPKRYRVQITPEIENHPWVTRYFNAQKNKIEFEFYKLEGEIKKTIDNYLFEQTDLKTLPDDFKQSMSGIQSVMLAEAFMKRGVLSISVFEELANSDIDLIKRFARVIDEAFNRVEELRIAETSAKEAKIEAALERVRARAMAIRKSDELQEVITIILKELNRLGFDLMESSIIIFDPPSKDLIVWGTGVANPEFATGKRQQYFEHSFLDGIFHDAEKGVRFRTGILEKVQLKTYFDKLFTITDFKDQSRQYIEEMYKIEQVYYAHALFKHGFLEVIGLNPVSSEKAEILKRFSNVVDLTYTRFDDIKQAEKQAREAQIEAALERVRSRTMGMQHSDELQEAAVLLFQQVIALGVPAFGSGFNILDDDRKYATAWMAGQDRMQPPFKTSSSKDIFLRICEAEKKGESLFVEEQGGEALKEHFEYMLSIPVFKKIADKMASVGQSFPTFQILHCAFFSQGYLMFITFEPVPDAYDIFKRFAKVFEQTYTRFLDLQKAEKQAKDALKQASLDRVRGEIASMRTSEDLNRITPVIWRELQALQVPFFRCGVFIINEKEEKVHVYLTTPSGKALAALHLALDANELTKNTVEHWRGKHIFKTHWNKEEFINWSKSMVQIGQVESVESYQGANDAPESLNLHFVPFRQGMLYVGDVNPLTNDKIELVKTLAEAFSIAYARYEDFKNLEEAKNKIELTLTELKAAQSQLIQSEKMASLGELTAGIAHEIQNPLNFVNNFSEVNSELMDEMDEEINNGNLEEIKAIAKDLKENEAKINHHGKRAESIVKGMLLHSRGSSGQKEPTDINALCDEYLRLSFHGFRAKDKSFNAEFKLETDESLPKIEVVPQDIGRVLLNLINNAFFAVNERAKTPQPPEGGAKNAQNDYKPEVIVSTSSSPFGEGGTKGGLKGVTITVSDNGPGIPSSIKEKIFQPFFTTKPTGQGTGLGLSLSYDIVKAHGGTLEVKSQSESDTGTEFIIQIPFK